MTTTPPRRDKSLIKRWFFLLVLLALPAVWHFTPLRESVDFETLARWQHSVRGSPAAPYLIVGAYLLGALVFFPVTVLSVVTVFTFGPTVGGTYSLIGWLLGALLGYAIGRGLGRDFLWDMAGPRLRRLELAARRHGFVTVVTMRLLPVAPFTLVNLFIGASDIRFRDFFLGSLLGRMPGLVALLLFAHQLEYALRAPGLASLLVLGVAVLLVIACVWLPRHFEAKRRSRILTGDNKAAR